MATRTPKTTTAAATSAVAADPAQQTPRNFRGRLVFKSGAVQDLVYSTANTNAFDVMRSAYHAHLAGKGQGFGSYAINGTYIVRWSEVDSFQTWID